MGREPKRPLFRLLPPPVVGAGLLRLLVVVLKQLCRDHPTAGEVVLVAIGPQVAAGDRVLQLRAARAIAVDGVVFEAPSHWRWRVHRLNLRLLAVNLLGLEPTLLVRLPVAVPSSLHLVAGELGSGGLSKPETSAWEIFVTLASISVG